MTSIASSPLGPTLFGAEVLRQVADQRQSVELRWIAQDKAYILQFSSGRPAAYVAPSGTTTRDPETVRKVLRAFAVSVDGFVQLEPLELDAPLAIDTLGEALVSVLHALPERSAAQILESRAGRHYVAGPRYDAIARAMTQSRGPMLSKPSAAVSLRKVTKGVSIEARRGWLTLIALGAVEQSEAPAPQPAHPPPVVGAAARQSRSSNSFSASARSFSSSSFSASRQSLATGSFSAAVGGRDKAPEPDPDSEAAQKAHLLELTLPTDPDAVHAALDLKKRLTTMFDKTHYEVLNIPKNASKDSIRSAYFELAKTYHLDRFSTIPLGEYQLVAEEVFRKISEASRILSDDDERSNYDVFLDRKERGLPTDVNVILEADNLFQRGKLMVERGQGANAYDELARAFELNSVDVDYRIYYAYAKYLAQGQGSFAEAVELLRKVLKEEPKHPQAHDFLGRMYRAEGNLKAAAAHLQKAIEIEPKNADAQRELRVVQMRLNKRTDDGKGSFLKGLLKR